jgi:hypothetical protein
VAHDLNHQEMPAVFLNRGLDTLITYSARLAGCGGWLAGWAAGWLAGWLAGRLAGWLAG